jgi:hypothetical protein
MMVVGLYPPGPQGVTHVPLMECDCPAQTLQVKKFSALYFRVATNTKNRIPLIKHPGLQIVVMHVRHRD